MRVLIVHNRYRIAGGEETVVSAETELLLAAGHEVLSYEKTNDHIDNIFAKAKAALQVSYSRSSREELRAVLETSKPDLVHCHSFFPSLTPSIFDACHDYNLPVVLTLHNYRLVCPSGSLCINGQVDETALEKGPYFAALKRPYRHSLIGSLAVARMIARHHKAGTWRQKITRFITMTEFAKRKFIRAGIPGDKIDLKPHFTRDPGPLADSPRNGALFVGRLTREKGVHVLLEAWQKLDMPLTLVGEDVEGLQRRNQKSNIRFVGAQDPETVSSLMSQASFLVFPSVVYESFGLVLIEAMAHGLPVVAFDIAGTSEIVADGHTGLLVQPGNVTALSDAIRQLRDGPIKEFSLNARQAYVDSYTGAANYPLLHAIYDRAIQEHRKRH